MQRAVASMCLALALLASGSGQSAYGHHFGHHPSWMSGYIVSGYGYGLGPYVSQPLVVSGLYVYGPQPGIGFGAGAPNGVVAGGGGGMGGGGMNVGGGGMPGVAAPGPAIGGGQGGGQVVGGQAMGGGQGNGGAVPGDFQMRGKPRTTNTETKARAGKFIQYGDALFLKQKYNSALARYRDAATTAPDLADPYFRQAFALVGSNQYDAAKKAIERGLRVRPNWPDTGFELSTLYGPGGHLAKTSHRESLASAIEQNPQSADLLLMMGVLLYCDSERDRSRLFFDRAIELGANEDHLFDRFIAPRPRDAALADPAAKRGNL